MLNCIDIGEKHFEKQCSKSKITTDIILQFFSDPTECSISVVYLNRYNDGESINKVFVKRMDDTNVFFTHKNGYFFVYNILLSQLFGWSKHPRSFGVRGYLGNHVSISENADIHETIYETKKSAIGGHDIIYKKKHVFLKLDENQDIINSRVENSIAHVYWNDIRCFADKSNISSGGVNNRVLKRTRTKIINYNNKEFCNIFKKRYNLQILKENETLFIRMPYIQPFKANILKKKLIMHCNESIHDIHIFTDSFSKSSFVALHF